MNQSQTLSKLAPALVAAQSELHGAKENAKNPFLKNDYADLESFIETAKPVLSKNKLAITQLVSGDGETIGVETILMHESGEFISSSVSLKTADEKGKSAAQVAGSIVTYLRRYGYSAILGMYASGEDTDGNKPHQQPPAQPVKVSTGVNIWQSRPGNLVNDITEKIGYFGKDRAKVLKALEAMTNNGKIKPSDEDNVIYAAVNKAANDKANAAAATGK